MAADTTSIGDEQDAIDQVLATTRELVEGVLVIEHRLATIAALAERFGTRYVQRSTTELQAATDQLTGIEERRRAAVLRATMITGQSAVETLSELIAITGEPLRTFLIDARTELAAAQLRINLLRGRADDVLGRRIALIVEVLATPGDITHAIYGRSSRARPRLVSAHL